MQPSIDIESIVNRVLSTLAHEFGSVSVEEVVLVIVRLGIAAILGGLLGYERENQGKSAGIRTHILVSMGAAMLILAPVLNGTPKPDLSRIIQGIVTGIGFLGAGTIVKTKGIDVHGLTTAAGIWVTAAIGLAVGLGQWMPAVIATGLMMFVLSYFKILVDKTQSLDNGSKRAPKSDVDSDES